MKDPLNSSNLPKLGFAAAKIETFVLNTDYTPALFIETVPYSIASCNDTTSSGLHLLNSSIHKIPPSGKTKAPPSNINSPV